MRRVNQPNRHRYGVDINHYLDIDRPLYREVRSWLVPECQASRDAENEKISQKRITFLREEGSLFRFALTGMFPTTGSVRGVTDGKGKDKKRPSEPTDDIKMSILSFPVDLHGTLLISDSAVPLTPIERNTAQLDKHSPAIDGTPSSIFQRPLTPVPQWPLPILKNGNHRPLPLTKVKEVRPSTSKASLSGKDAQPRSPRLTSGYSNMIGRFPATPSLPSNWSIVHDRAICVLDACDYSLTATVKKLRSAFPELVGSVLTPVMIDKRLRTLDQNPNVDFFRIGLEHLLLTRDDENDDSNASRIDKVDRKTRIERRNTTPSVPSFSSISTGRQNSGLSITDSLRDITFKTTPESDRSVASSSGSKIPRATSKGVVRSYPFGTGYMSYRTTADEEASPRESM